MDTAPDQPLTAGQGQPTNSPKPRWRMRLGVLMAVALILWAAKAMFGPSFDQRLTELKVWEVGAEWFCLYEGDAFCQFEADPYDEQASASHARRPDQVTKRDVLQIRSPQLKFRRISVSQADRLNGISACYQATCTTEALRFYDHVYNKWDAWSPPANSVVFTAVVVCKSPKSIDAHIGDKPHFVHEKPHSFGGAGSYVSAPVSSEPEWLVEIQDGGTNCLTKAVISKLVPTLTASRRSMRVRMMEIAQTLTEKRRKRRADESALPDPPEPNEKP